MPIRRYIYIYFLIGKLQIDALEIDFFSEKGIQIDLAQRKNKPALTVLHFLPYNNIRPKSLISIYNKKVGGFNCIIPSTIIAIDSYSYAKENKNVWESSFPARGGTKLPRNIFVILGYAIRQFIG